jgi:GT2 family glycosyltransferase
MTPTPKVSVVIVSWNARDYLTQCLRSLTAEACAYPLEIIVVDNASADGSPELVARDFPGVRLIQTGANLGFAKANNIGIRASSGKYVALINSDVLVLPGCLTRLADFAEQHPEVGMLGPRVIGGDGKLQRSCRGFPGVWNMFCRAVALDAGFPRQPIFCGYLLQHWAHEEAREVDILSGCFWLVRAAALERVGLLDEDFFMYGEDMDWCKRFWVAGWRLRYFPGAEAIHYGGASSANAPVRFFIEKQRADLRYWKKHHGVPARGAYFLISCLYHLLRMVGYAAVAGVRRGAATEARFKLRRSFQCLQWMLSPRRDVVAVGS